MDPSSVLSTETVPGQKVAVITGAGTGIGRAVAVAYASNGYDVTLIGRTGSSLEETASLCATPALIAIADVCDETSIESAIHKTLLKRQRIDVLFNSAGLFGEQLSFASSTAANWRRVIDVNLTGSYLASRSAFRVMRDQIPQGGRIILCGSLSAHSPRPKSAAYTASKHAITGLAKSISLEGRPFGIGASQLDIGNAATSMTDEFGTHALQADGSVRAEPLMDVQCVADAALFVSSLPMEASVLSMTVLASGMPFVGRG